jgi:hypothetical protein
MQGSESSIRIYDRPGGFWLEVNGPLTGPAVRELELCWQTGASILRGRGLVVDLTPATAIDSAGESLLGRLSRAGASFVVPDSGVGRAVARVAGPIVEPVRRAAPRGFRDAVRRVSRFLLCPFFHCQPQPSRGL